jgi:hypothetical protein
LSIPTTRAPSLANRLTVSDPINPADPVTMIVRTMSILACVAQASSPWGRRASRLRKRATAGEMPACPHPRRLRHGH